MAVLTDKKVLLLHGWGGSDFPHWQAWIAGEIVKNYGSVSFPLLHNPHFPSKNRWMSDVKELLKDFKPDIVICHSLANTLWFHLCNEGDIEQVEHLLLVAPPSLSLDIETIKTFFPVTAPKDLFAKDALLVTSTNDPYMSKEEAKQLQNALNIEMKVLEDAGHINEESGFGKWPWVKEWLSQIEKNNV